MASFTVFGLTQDDEQVRVRQLNRPQHLHYADILLFDNVVKKVVVVKNW